MNAVVVVVALVVGVALGALTVAVYLALRPRPVPVAAPAVPPAEPTAPSTAVLALAAVDALRVAVVVLGPSDEVLLANPAARRIGLLRAGRLQQGPVLDLARTVRRDGTADSVDVEGGERRFGRESLALHAVVTPVGGPFAGLVAVLVEDRTDARRVEDVRRDFVANVSHELKTPVGALSLLAEALLDAPDDAVAVRRFAGRMQHESGRLARLVQELIDLSRLQGADPPREPTLVDLDHCVAEALDRTRLGADARTIDVVSGGNRGIKVLGDEAQIVTALVNLVDNAIHYSPEHTRVAIGIRLHHTDVEISVSDQGIGIAERDLERVFERFYRADPARSRATGGTGLGLAIVKHIATNHGGAVTVWSVEGSGSTFTLRLPAADSQENLT